MTAHTTPKPKANCGVSRVRCSSPIAHALWTSSEAPWVLYYGLGYKSHGLLLTKSPTAPDSFLMAAGQLP